MLDKPGGASFFKDLLGVPANLRLIREALERITPPKAPPDPRRTVYKPKC
jgi:hypothetical protein